jgi:RNA polymerase sigma-70 factor (ECF subfamily)
VEEKRAIEYFLAERTGESFRALFEALCGRLRRYFLLRGLDRATAEDLTQEVFVKVYRRAGELREAGRFYGWLFAIARNEMISHWRREDGASGQFEFELLDDLHAESLAIEPEVAPAMRMRDLLSALDPPDHDLIVLRFVEGLSYEELALALKLPLGTIKWRIFNARKKLARIIGASPECRARQRIN